MSAPTGLGKGLGALIPSGARMLEELPISAIAPNPKQPRNHFDDESLATLSASIRQLGLLQPVVVRRRGDDRYELVMGERRWRASHRAGLATIPALIVETDDRGSLERALVENLHRQDLNAIEEAAAFQQLVTDAGLTHEQLAERVGLSRPAITNALRLLELPDAIQKLVLDSKLSAAHARTLGGLNGHPLQERLAARVAAEGLSVRATEDLVRQNKQGATASTPGRGNSSRGVGLSEISERLSDELATRVSVVMGKRKGKIVIEFGSGEDLDRLVAKITSNRTTEDGSAL